MAIVFVVIDTIFDSLIVWTRQLYKVKRVPEKSPVLFKSIKTMEQARVHNVIGVPENPRATVKAECVRPPTISAPHMRTNVSDEHMYCLL